MSFPRNLTQRAFDDYTAILRRSLATFGATTAAQTSDRLLARCRQVQDGTALGRRHPNILFVRPILCLTEKPFLIFYDDGSCIILRIVDGRRDLPALFADDVS